MQAMPTCRKMFLMIDRPVTSAIATPIAAAAAIASESDPIMAGLPELISQGRTGITAPTLNEKNDQAAVEKGDAKSPGDTPSSSRT